LATDTADAGWMVAATALVAGVALSLVPWNTDRIVLDDPEGSRAR
jgi:hypothetical protein